MTALHTFRPFAERPVSSGGTRSDFSPPVAPLEFPSVPELVERVLYRRGVSKDTCPMVMQQIDATGENVILCGGIIRVEKDGSYVCAHGHEQDGE